MNMDHLIIFGCVLCTIYCWLMGYISRTNELKVSKLGIVIGTIGILTLSGMALVESPRNLESERKIMVIKDKQDVPQRTLLHKKLLSLYYRTLNEVGKPPTKDHVAYEDENGKFSWIPKDYYLKILIKQKKKDSE